MNAFNEDPYWSRYIDEPRINKILTRCPAMSPRKSDGTPYKLSTIKTRCKTDLHRGRISGMDIFKVKEPKYAPKKRADRYSEGKILTGKDKRKWITGIRSNGVHYWRRLN
jgi:hypothetical protein